MQCPTSASSSARPALAPTVQPVVTIAPRPGPTGSGLRMTATFCACDELASGHSDGLGLKRRGFAKRGEENCGEVASASVARVAMSAGDTPADSTSASTAPRSATMSPDTANTAACRWVVVGNPHLPAAGQATIGPLARGAATPGDCLVERASLAVGVRGHLGIDNRTVSQLQVPVGRLGLAGVRSPLAGDIDHPTNHSHRGLLAMARVAVAHAGHGRNPTTPSGGLTSTSIQLSWP